MAQEAEYKILVKRTWTETDSIRDDDDNVDVAAEEFSAEVTEHIRDGWSLHGPLSAVTSGVGHKSSCEVITVFTQALVKEKIHEHPMPGGPKRSKR